MGKIDKLALTDLEYPSHVGVVRKINDIVDWINQFEDDLENGRFKLTIDDDKYYTLKRFEKD